MQEGAQVDERLPRLSDGGRHRRHLSAVRLCELAKPADRFRKLLAPAGDLRGLLLFRFQQRRKRRDGRARLWSFESVTAAESRDIAAARHFDDEGIVAPNSGIISRQRLTHAHSLDAHDRIGLRIKIGAATERFDGDGIGFELVAVTRKRHFDNERKKACEAIRVAERTAADDPIELLADVVGMRPLRICKSRVAISSGKCILHCPWDDAIFRRTFKFIQL